MCIQLDNEPTDLYGHFSAGKLSRRTLLDTLLAGGLASMLGPQALAADNEEVRIGYLPITDATPLLVAHALGYFEEVGLEAPRPTLIRSWPALVESFSTRKFNIVHLLKPIPIWMRYNNKIPVKIAAWCHTNGSALVVGGKSNITSFADCGGRQIAVPFWYSMHNVLLQMALRNAGLTPVIKPQGSRLGPTETNLQVLPPPEMPAALAARKIDAYIVAEPFNALGELKANGRILRFTGDIWKNHPCCVVTMHESDMTERAAWSQKVIDAIVKASIYASRNKGEVARLLSRDGEGYLPVPHAVVKRAMTYYNVPEYTDTNAVMHADEWGNGRIDFAPYPYPSATELLVTEMGRTIGGGANEFLAGLDPSFVANDLVNYDFVRRALTKHPDWLKEMGHADGNFVRDEIIAL